MNAFTIKHENRTIVITKDYAKKSSNPNNKEFKELVNLKKAYREYDVVIRESRQRNSKTSKINLANMRAYIKNHDTDGTIMSEFEKVVRESKNSIQYSGFFGVKKWFFEQYSELKEEA
jgi:HD superfamily phosphohydrolase